MEEKQNDQWNPQDPGDRQKNEGGLQKEGYPNEGGDSDSETNYGDKTEREISIEEPEELPEEEREKQPKTPYSENNGERTNGNPGDPENSDSDIMDNDDDDDDDEDEVTDEDVVTDEENDEITNPSNRQIL